MRTGQFLPSAALCGTSFDGRVEPILEHSGVTSPRVGIWTDPDKAGMRAADKLETLMSLMGVEHGRIASERDPKKHSDFEIWSYLDDRPSAIADHETSSGLLNAVSVSEVLGNRGNN